MSRWLCDFHVHTCFSYDATAPLDKLAEAFNRAGLQAVAITDHNAFGAHRDFGKYFDGFTIPGEEIQTTKGEIIGLFLKEFIPPYLSPEATVEAIRAQGGVVCVPHPFVRVVPSRLESAVLEELVGQVDAVEILNCRNPFPVDDLQAMEFARKHGLGRTGGSDAHLVCDAGAMQVEVEAFSTAEELKRALLASRLKRWRRIPQYENLYNFLVAGKQLGWSERFRQAGRIIANLKANSLKKST